MTTTVRDPALAPADLGSGLPDVSGMTLADLLAAPPNPVLRHVVAKVRAAAEDDDRPVVSAFNSAV